MITSSQGPQQLYRIDKFKVPQSARGEFLERVRSTHQFLRTLPGFVRDALFEQTSGPGAFNFVTLVEWESAEALESAKKAVIAKHEEVGFNPKEMFARLGIDADLANYTQLEAQAGGKMPNAGLEETIQGFFEAFNRGDLDAVMALYEPKATMVAQPGQMAEGHAAIREALIGFLAMKPTLATEKKSLVTAGDIALAVIRWTLNGKGPDGAPVRMEGTSSDVLHRQADGRWLFVIDNPWGADILT